MKTINTVDRELPCRLTEEEIKNKGKELAQLHSEMAKEETRQKSEKAKLKESITKIQTAMEKLAFEVRNQSEERKVVVLYEMNDDGTVIKEVRQDTGEIINIRAPSQSELQAGLFEEK